MNKNCIKKTIVLSSVFFAMAAVFSYPGGNSVVSAHRGEHSQKNHGKCYLNKKKVDLCTGETYALKLKGGKGKSAWTTSDKSVATVTKKGRIKAVGKGKCTIKCKNRKKIYKCRVKVKLNPAAKQPLNPLTGSENKGYIENKEYIDNNGSLCNYFIKYDLNNILRLSDGTSAACPYNIYRQNLNGVPITYNGTPLSAADLKPGDVLKVNFTYPQKCIYPCPIENITSIEVTDRKPEYAQIKYYYNVLRTDGDTIYIMLNGNEFAISSERNVKNVILGNYDGKQPDSIVVKAGNQIRIIDDNGCDIDPAFFGANPFIIQICR